MPYADIFWLLLPLPFHCLLFIAWLLFHAWCRLYFIFSRHAYMPANISIFSFYYILYYAILIAALIISCRYFRFFSSFQPSLLIIFPFSFIDYRLRFHYYAFFHHFFAFFIINIYAAFSPFSSLSFITPLLFLIYYYHSCLFRLRHFDDIDMICWYWCYLIYYFHYYYFALFSLFIIFSSCADVTIDDIIFIYFIIFIFTFFWLFSPIYFSDIFHIIRILLRFDYIIYADDIIVDIIFLFFFLFSPFCFIHYYYLPHLFLRHFIISLLFTHYFFISLFDTSSLLLHFIIFTLFSPLRLYAAISFISWHYAITFADTPFYSFHISFFITPAIISMPLFFSPLIIFFFFSFDWYFRLPRMTLRSLMLLIFRHAVLMPIIHAYSLFSLLLFSLYYYVILFRYYLIFCRHDAIWCTLHFYFAIIDFRYYYLALLRCFHMILYTLDIVTTPWYIMFRYRFAIIRYYAFSIYADYDASIFSLFIVAIIFFHYYFVIFFQPHHFISDYHFVITLLSFHIITPLFRHYYFADMLHFLHWLRHSICRHYFTLLRFHWYYFFIDLYHFRHHTRFSLRYMPLVFMLFMAILSVSFTILHANTSSHHYFH